MSFQTRDDNNMASYYAELVFVREHREQAPPLREAIADLINDVADDYNVSAWDFGGDVPDAMADRIIALLEDRHILPGDCGEAAHK